VHQRLEIPTEGKTQEHVYQKPVKDANELKQYLIEMWSATSKASLIKRLISGKIVLMRAPQLQQSQETPKPEANTLNIYYNVFLYNLHDF